MPPSGRSRDSNVSHSQPRTDTTQFAAQTTSPSASARKERPRLLRCSRRRALKRDTRRVSRKKKKKKTLESSNAVGHDDADSVAYTLRRRSSAHTHGIHTHDSLSYVFFFFYRESQRPRSRKKKKVHSIHYMSSSFFFFFHRIVRSINGRTAFKRLVSGQRKTGNKSARNTMGQ